MNGARDLFDGHEIPLDVLDDAIGPVAQRLGLTRDVFASRLRQSSLYGVVRDRRSGVPLGTRALHEDSLRTLQFLLGLPEGEDVTISLYDVAHRFYDLRKMGPWLDGDAEQCALLIHCTDRWMRTVDWSRLDERCLPPLTFLVNSLAKLRPILLNSQSVRRRVGAVRGDLTDGPATTDVTDLDRDWLRRLYDAASRDVDGASAGNLDASRAACFQNLEARSVSGGLYALKGILLATHAIRAFSAPNAAEMWDEGVEASHRTHSGELGYDTSRFQTRIPWQCFHFRAEMMPFLHRAALVLLSPREVAADPVAQTDADVEQSSAEPDSDASDDHSWRARRRRRRSRRAPGAPEEDDQS